MIEKIAAEIVRKCPYISEEHRQDFSFAVSAVLGKYEISEKKAELIVYENRNARDKQAFFATKMVEGLSPKSLKYYQGEIDKFDAFVQKDYADITTDDIRYYLGKSQIDKKLSKATVDNIRRILASFFSWLNAEGRIPTNPTKRIKPIKKDKRKKKAFTPSEIERLKTQCYKGCDMSKFSNDSNAKESELRCKRLLALIEVFLSTGMRVGEAAILKKEDCDFQNRKAVVFGKGAKERTVYFNDTAMLRIEDYLRVRSDSSPYLFAPLRQSTRLYLTNGDIEKEIRALGKAAGIDDCHPHKFRRTMATTALKKGMSIFDIQKLLGHEEIETTKIYLDIDDSAVEAAHRKYL